MHAEEPAPPPGATHAVFNQPPPLEDVNLFSSHRVLVEGLRREGAAWAEEEVRVFGEVAGRRETIAWGFQANAFPPVLRTHDRAGRRIDEVDFHPSWHVLLALGVEHGLHALPWSRPHRGRPGAQVARAAKFLMLAQVEAGVGCPLSMTYSAVPALAAEPELAAEWIPRLTAAAYDPRLAPARDKAGALCGMAMTEKQGGSDVRANTTRARPAGSGGAYEITGHKWFCSAPMCDAFLVLAQAPGGLTCFLLPRFTPDGERNRFHLQRLKDKLGNRSNASSEVELAAAWARRVGDEGRGVATIIEMVNHTRLDCVLGSAALMRQAVAQAIHYARHRSAFGRRLHAQPLMANVLAGDRLRDEVAPLTRAPGEAAMGRAEPLARRLVEGLATALQASLLVRHSPAAVADAFCAARLDAHGLAFGTLPAGLDPAAIAAIQERHAPCAEHTDAS